MNGKRYIWTIVLISVALVTGGCEVAAIGPATESATDTPQAVRTEKALVEKEPTKALEPTPAQGVSQARNVAYQGVSLTFDPAIAAGVLTETALGADEQGGIWTAEPAHLRFLLDGYALPWTLHEPRVVIYPVAEFEAVSEYAADTIAHLRQLLADRPATPGTIPPLPPFNAEQLMRAQVAYIDFQNGTGVRFLTQYAQAYVPINNHELFYTFQGLTDDGHTYVAAILPVSHPGLPADQTAYEGDPNTLARNFDAYIAGVEEQLDAQGASSFTPDLSLLDTMLQSLEVGPRPGHPTLDPPPAG
jgi:hypothetical protein